MRTMLCSLLLMGCSPHLMSISRLPEAEERQAIESVIESYEEARGEVDCPPLHRSLIVTLPDDQLQSECLADYMSRVTGTDVRVSACVYQIQRQVFEAPRTAIYLSADLDRQGRLSAIRHESAHAIRACHLRDPDRAHLDDELWNRIIARASE